MASAGKIMFGIIPGDVLDTSIDYTTSIGWKQLEGSIKSLCDKLYDGSLDKMRMFIKNLKCWATITGWTSICEINGKSLFENFGKINLERCINYAKQYYVLETSSKLKETRRAQMSQQMLACIRSPISD